MTRSSKYFYGKIRGHTDESARSNHSGSPAGENKMGIANVRLVGT